jgi:hypothetical protein
VYDVGFIAAVMAAGRPVEGGHDATGSGSLRIF